MGGSIEPGWYADPQGDAQTLRWWNGSEWTRHTRSLSELQGRGDPGDEEAATTHLGGSGQGGSGQGAPASDEEDPGTVRLGPSQTQSAAPIDDEPSTMRINPSWAQGSPPAGHHPALPPAPDRRRAQHDADQPVVDTGFLLSLFPLPRLTAPPAPPSTTSPAPCASTPPGRGAATMTRSPPPT
ncbi:DUF2510 domain-containing protein [Nocardiopsis dassonvillei]|uniref:DUF2510 domain-containing protein n=1 Tax=Nocardiopsis dassonvillei TaxID=2014 RepID=UPI0008FCD38D|nr:DUF2510 domain-containing protein [Nocardiopsis dassonvillei]